MNPGWIRIAADEREVERVLIGKHSNVGLLGRRALPFRDPELAGLLRAGPLVLVDTAEIILGPPRGADTLNRPVAGPFCVAVQ